MSLDNKLVVICDKWRSESENSFAHCELRLTLVTSDALPMFVSKYRHSDSPDLRIIMPASIWVISGCAGVDLQMLFPLQRTCC